MLIVEMRRMTLNLPKSCWPDVPRSRQSWVLVLALLVPVSARADGDLAQIHLSASDSTLVLNAERRRLSYGATVYRDDKETSVTASAQFGWKSAGQFPWIVRVGPALHFKGRDFRGGLRAGLERYVGMETGGIFTMVQHTTIDQASFGLASWRHYASGLGVEGSIYKEAGERRSPALSVTWQRPETLFTVQAGYRTRDDEAFVGLTWSRF